ncbi:MAG: hypothetical protein PQJ50_14540, partial [Spirochaetales bacterium]|nr:hypothetical protein [Spirochaetales bacterium]
PTRRSSDLKSLKRGLEASLDIPFRISDSQHDRNGVIFTLIDEKIRDYSLIWKSLPPEPKIYDRR